MKTAISLLAAFILGGIPTGYWVGMLVRGVDVRKHGSGNLGATNVVRVLGPAVGVPVMFFDIAKGAAAVLLARALGCPSLFVLLSGFLAILGHNFTPFLRFKGGKGVAASAGVFLALTPWPLLIAVSVFILVFALSRYVSLGSMLAAGALFLSELAFNLANHWNHPELLAATFAVMALILFAHRGNIKRLAHGNENRLTFSKRSK